MNTEEVTAYIERGEKNIALSFTRNYGGIIDGNNDDGTRNHKRCIS